jgi:hypothetical protein
MASSKRITSIMIAVALVTLAALAISTGWDSNRDSGRNPDENKQPDYSLLPGLAENLASLERITGHPLANFRSVIITRANSEKVTVIRESPGAAEFSFLNTPPADLTPFSAILFANASLLNQLDSADDFVVTGVIEDRVLGKLKYTSFDGLVLECIVFSGADAIWLRMIAAHAPKLANRFASLPATGLLPADEIKQTARRLNGRVYKAPDRAQ